MFKESRIFHHFRLLFVYTNPLKILWFILGFSRDHLLDFCSSADRYRVLISSMIEALCVSTVIFTLNFLALVVLLMLHPDIYSFQ